MLHSLRLRVLGLMILGACALALPATASAAEHWQRIADPAPGGTPDDGTFRIPDTAVAVSGNTAYLVDITAVGRIEVYSARPGDASWRLIGKLHQTGDEAIGFPAIAVSGKTIWVAWYQLEDADSLAHLHLALSSGGAFREIGRGDNPLGAPAVFLATRPSIVPFRGDVYVTSSSGVLRVSKNGKRVEQVSAGSGLGSDVRAWLVEVGNRLYLVHGSGSSTVVSRLNRSGSAWDTVASTDAGPPSDAAAGGGTLYVVVDNGVGLLMRLTPAGTLQPLTGPDWLIRQVAVVGGVVYVAGTETPAAEAPAELRIFALETGAWRQVADPVAPDPDVERFDLIDGGSNLWLHWVSTPRGPFSAPITVHVARLLR
jgi:hypothetical protein